MGRLTGLLVLVLACALHASAAEVLYLEDFESQEGKGVTGSGGGGIGSTPPPPPTFNTSGVGWTINASGLGLRDANDYFRVNSGVFEGRDLDGTGRWLSAGMPTAAGQLIEVSVEYDGRGSVFESTDQFVISLSTDGGSNFVPFFGYAGAGNTMPAGTATTSAVGNGESFFVSVAATNNSGGEVFAFDNVTFTAIPEPLAASAALLGFGALVLRRRKDESLAEVGG